ncbi:MAG: dihydrofolate reductase family protein [Sphingorhabdus sp.]|uniref:dihydrofolate reductase family protein n=1 Tax=Sphingorhabdus sp. TaxID=1902408 RepID=UPI003CB2C1B7
MKKIIVALQISLDGFIEGLNGEIDWIDTWEDRFGIMSEIDTFIMGGGMYGGYEFYWRSILADPTGVLPFSGKTATVGEVEYARFADQTPHLILTNSLTDVSWSAARVVNDFDAIRDLKRQDGKDIHAVGGATFVGSLFREGLVDEVRLLVHPVILGGGKALFKDVAERHALTLVKNEALDTGHVLLTYAVRAD